MKFKFLGKPTLLADFTTHKIYNILQFEVVGKNFCVYVIDNNKELICIPYRSLDLFNKNWGYVE